MLTTILRNLFFVAVFGAWVSGQEAGVEYFETRVRPVLAERCYKCHGPKRQRGKLRLDSPAAILRGGESGPAVVPHDPDHSPLVIAIRYDNPDFQMPPKGRLGIDAVRDLTEWVSQGASMPKGRAAGPVSGENETAGKFDLQERRKHWAWQPLGKLDPPSGNHWGSSPVDAFIASRLKREGMTPAPMADRRTLIRRVHFDLLGLPPSADQVSTFLADTSADAWEKVVDGLLASPHFGEKWARHWLDLVRYAETRGFEFDFVLPNAWRYRDYVIRAFNEDVPYDRFVAEHVAGDLMENPRTHPVKGYNESVLGTGFWHFGEEGHSPVDTRADQFARTANKVDVFSKAFLGMTVACAQCHDHKFDAIATKDYYALTGFVHSSSFRQVRFESDVQNAGIAKSLDRIQAQSVPTLSRLTARRLKKGVGGMARSLLDARRAMGKEEGAKDGKVPGWVKHLSLAADQPEDPFHAWAILSRDASLKDKGRKTRGAVEGLAGKRRARSLGIPEGATVIVDYSAPDADWFTNGPSFGQRPAKVGDLVLGDDPAMPISRVVSLAAASRDRVWDVLRLAPDTQKEAGKVNWEQAGRTIRTRTFHLESGRLHYLVRGPMHVYVSLDSHRVLHGPLHVESAHSWPAGKGLHWVTHNLSVYKGHQVHIEFSPQGITPLEIVAAIDSEKNPGRPSLDNAWITGALQEGAAGGLTAVARAYQQKFSLALRHMEKNTLSETPDGADLADWLVRNHALLDSQDGASRALRKAGTPVVEARREALGKIVRYSAVAPSFMDGSGFDEAVLVRGNFKTPGEEAPRSFLTAIEGPRPMTIDSGSGRLLLAESMTSPDNPLVSRVMANRLWHHLFGRGLVSSTDNFGFLGERPTHPDLLDWLARAFMEEDGWSVKRSLRRLVLTNTYRMSSALDPRFEDIDPGNRLFHRMSVRRMTSESIRDLVLSVSGRLDPKMFGVPVPLHLTEFMQGRGRPPKSGPVDGAGRRSIYLAVRRNFLSPFLQAFDFPIPVTTMGRRTVSNVPTQALALMNDPFVVEQARTWARRILENGGERSTGDRVAEIYEMAFSRPPSKEEALRAVSFVEELVGDKKKGGHVVEAWASLCHVVMNAKEFWYLQ